MCQSRASKRSAPEPSSPAGTSPLGMSHCPGIGVGNLHARAAGARPLVRRRRRPRDDRWTIGLITQCTVGVLLKAVAFPVLRRPEAAVQHQPEEELHLLRSCQLDNIHICICESSSCVWYCQNSPSAVKSWLDPANPLSFTFATQLTQIKTTAHNFFP